VALLIVVLALAALAVGVDRVAAAVVQRQVASRLQTELGTPQPPKVTIEGFPFLTQVLDRRFRSVRVVGNGVGATNDQPEVAQVDMRLRDVVATSSYQKVSARQVTGSARLAYPQLEGLAGFPVSFAGDGRIALDVPTTASGVEVTAKVTGVPMLDVEAQSLTLNDPTISVAGIEIPADTSQSLVDSLQRPVPLKGIPLGLRVERVTAQPEHLEVAVTGSEVQLS
jgi:hypothetical protein